MFSIGVNSQNKEVEPLENGFVVFKRHFDFGSEQWVEKEMCARFSQYNHKDEDYLDWILSNKTMNDQAEKNLIICRLKE